MTISRLFLLTFNLVCLAAIFYATFDVSIIVWISTHQTPWMLFVGKSVQYSFTFYIWIVVVFVALIRNALRAGNLQAWASQKSTQFFLGVFIAMFICTILKVSLGRYRPEMFLTQHLYGFTGFALKNFRNSMPSDHTAIIFSIVTFFCLSIQRDGLRVLLVIAGLLLASTRVIYLKHYPSDVLIGMLVGVWGAYLANVFCGFFRSES